MAKFFRRGSTQIVFNTAAATPPTVANLTTGTNLTASVNDIKGFAFKNKPIEVPDMSSSFVSKIPGSDQADDSDIEVYIDSVGSANPLITSTLAKGVSGFLFLADFKVLGTWTSGDWVDVWPVTVASNAKEYSSKDEPALSMVTFVVTSPPRLNTTIA